MKKVEVLMHQPVTVKKTLSSANEEIDWDKANLYRRATKGSLTILKDKINKNFEKRKSFDMSFGLTSETKDEEATQAMNKSMQFG